MADVAISIAGSGTVRALASGTVVASGSFASPAMGWLTLAAADPVSAPIDSIEVTGNGGAGSVVVIAYLATTPVSNATVGLRYAMVHAPGKMPIPPAPATPVAIFRRRDAVAGPPGPSIRPRSLFDVQWVPAATASSRAIRSRHPAGLPPPSGIVGYVAQRADGNQAAAVSLNGVIAAAPQPTPADSPLLPAPAILRFTASGLPDPVSGYRFPHGRLWAVRPARKLQPVEQAHRAETHRRCPDPRPLCVV